MTFFSAKYAHLLKTKFLTPDTELKVVFIKKVYEIKKFHIDEIHMSHIFQGGKKTKYVSNFKQYSISSYTFFKQQSAKTMWPTYKRGLSES